MKRMILFLVLLFISVWIGLLIHEQKTGILFIVLKNSTIEIPLWFAIFALLLTYLTGFIALKLLGKLLHLGGWFQRSKKQWQTKHAQLNLRRGLIEFSEGNWKEAEHHLAKISFKGDLSLLNYLAAARAAQELGSSERRDEYLREAQKALPDAKIAIELTQAQLQIAGEQWEQALATLNHLHSLSPEHPYVMKLLVKVYLFLKDWKNLEQWILPIQRKKIMPEKDILRLENQVYSGLLEQEAKQGDLASLVALWEKFPKAIRKNAEVTSVYVLKLLEYQAHDVAEEICREALKNDWNNALILLYGQCEIVQTEEQLRFAEHFLKYQANNAYLLLTLGRICVRRGLWGKAKDYFLKSAQMQPEAEIYLELAKLSEILEETEMVHVYYKKSVALALTSLREFKREAKIESFPALDKVYFLAGKVIF